MKVNGYNLTDKQVKELIQTFRRNPELYMYDNPSKVQEFIDSNEHKILDSIDGTKLYFTEKRITILIKDK